MGCIAATDEAGDEEAGDEEAGESADLDIEEIDTREDGISGGTVQQAAASNCSTASVEGLSLQIIAEERCMKPDAYVKIPPRRNLSFGPAAYPYLQKPAHDRLVDALRDNPRREMRINSALRTAAQQYLLYRWHQTGRCSIRRAAKPGNSKHEIGLALDVRQHSTWRSNLETRGFRWLGSSDPVHFDYVGSGTVKHKGLGVKAFQRLWNRNHANDKISADGVWGPQTEARMKKAPANGFTIGAQCGSASGVASELAADLEPSASGGAPELEADLERSVEEPMLSVPEPIDAAFVEELDREYEAESCGDHDL
jgi:hypothetical protein